MKSFHLVFFFTFIIAFSSTGYSFADHGSGGGGSGCSGDCTPPTLGVDEYSRQQVSNGLIINGESYTVSDFSQSIPTQLIPIGEPVEIVLNIYENSGAFYLAHVQLMLGEEQSIISGQKVPSHPVQIIWEKTLDGDESFFVTDKNDLISNVSVESFVDGDPSTVPTTTLTFNFVVEKEFNSSPIVVNMWDYNRSSWKNYFYNAIEIDSEYSGMGEINFSESQKLNLPSWIKNNAGFWSENLIDDFTFVTGIKFCIKNNIIHVPDLHTIPSEDVLPFVDPAKSPQHYIDRYYNEPSYQEWFDTHFPDYTIEQAVGGYTESSAEIPLWIKNNAGWWADGQIDDKEFVNAIEYLVKNRIIVI